VALVMPGARRTPRRSHGGESLRKSASGSARTITHHPGRVPPPPLLQGSRQGVALVTTRCSVSLISEETGTQGLEGASEEAGDVHLRDAELLTDLGLGHLLDEAHVQDPTLAFIELGDERGE
jgi:hypothetical protein